MSVPRADIATVSSEARNIFDKNEELKLGVNNSLKNFAINVRLFWEKRRDNCKSSDQKLNMMMPVTPSHDR
jgi:hypothetical protein